MSGEGKTAFQSLEYFWKYRCPQDFKSLSLLPPDMVLAAKALSGYHP